MDDLIADIAAADPADAFMDVSSLSALDEPEPQPALLVEVLQSSTNPTVAHLGAVAQLGLTAGPISMHDCSCGTNAF